MVIGLPAVAEVRDGVRDGVGDALAGARGWLGEAIFQRVAGPNGEKHRDRIHLSPGPRWYAPGSAIHQVHGDASMFIAGIRALMLQSLHPAAMTAVAEHSAFRTDMWGRLANTSVFVATTTFGTAADAEAAVAAVRRIHDRITGTMPDGTPYAASDPHLLGWVHVAEVDSFLRTHQRYGQAPLDQAGRDEYVAQAAVVAEKLGVLDPPRSEAELDAALAAYRPELRGTRHAREAVRTLIWHPELPLAARPGYLVLVAAAISLMPLWTRRQLLLPWLPVTERTVVRVLGHVATGTIRWALPGAPAADRVATA